MKLSLVVPCCNEEDNVSLFYKEIKKVFKNKRIDLELVFVNDGSTDNTLKELKKITKDKKISIKIINFSRNFGKEAAMYAGLSNVSGDYVAVMDADLQHPPKLLIDMLDILVNNSEYDVISACQERKNTSFMNIIFSKIYNMIINRYGDIRLKAGVGDYNLFRKMVVDSILRMKEHKRFSRGILSWLGYNTYYVYYTPNKRINGKSKWPLKKLFKYGIDGIISYTDLPMKIAIILGNILLIIAIIGFVVKYNLIIDFILLIGGFNLLFMGFIGMYILNIYIEVKNRPLYVIRDIITK